MVNTCVVFGCKSGYSSQIEKVSCFSFPFDKPDLLKSWVKFVNRKNWSPTKNSVICVKHFEEKYIKDGQRKKLRWENQPVPTIHTDKELKRPSVLPSPGIIRKKPKIRVYQKDELGDFENVDKIKSFSDLNENCAPASYLYHKTADHVVYYKLIFKENGFPIIRDSIKVDKEMHVQLEVLSNPAPLPQWFVNGRNALLTKFSMLENFPSYLSSIYCNKSNLISEINHLQFYKPKGRPSFSCEMIRFALLLRYTSFQAYSLLLEHLPLPSISLLKRLRKGDLDAIKAAELLRGRGKIDNDVVMMVDEVYLKKCAQYSGGDFIGSDENGKLYKGVVVFMVQGLKNSVPIVIKACPETVITGSWLAEEMSDCISSLSSAGFNVRAIVTDNHASNVSAFSSLHKMHDSGDCLAIKHPKNKSKTYLFFDNVHLVKNIRNNLLNRKKIVFPPFSFEIGKFASIASQGGYIAWNDLTSIFDNDAKLDANLRQAHKLTLKSLYPYNNKQNVALALAVFDETTIAAAESYLPKRNDAVEFLTLINIWWTIVNSKKRFSVNKLANALVCGDGKVSFLMEFSNWLEDWSKSSCLLTLSKQTCNALIQSLRGQAHLCYDLFAEGYDFVIPAKFQSDPLEKRFSQYRQMSGGNFLVSLREILVSEKTLLFRSLLKSNVNVWQEDICVKPHSPETFQIGLENLDCEVETLSLSPESAEVAFTIAGYISKKIKKRIHGCIDCNISQDSADVQFFKHLSRGGLTAPSAGLADFVSTGFALMDANEEFIRNQSLTARDGAICMLHYFLPDTSFLCSDHAKWGMASIIKIIVNVFYNNKQRLANDSVTKDSIAGFKKRQRAKIA